MSNKYYLLTYLLTDRAVCQWKPIERTRTTAEVITGITQTIIQSTMSVLKVKYENTNQRHFSRLQYLTAMMRYIFNRSKKIQQGLSHKYKDKDQTFKNKKY